MKLYFFLILNICLSCFSILAKEIKIDNVVAVVNDQIILNSDVNKIMFLLNKEKKYIKIPVKKDVFKNKIIKKLIIDNLILQEAEKMNIKVTEEQVNDVIQNIASRQNITVDELKKNILLNNFNKYFNYDDYLRNIKNVLKMKIVQDYELQKRVHISEHEINVLYKKLLLKNNRLKKINLSYILLPFAEKTNNDQFQNNKELAENVVRKLKKGYNFRKIYKINKKYKKLETIFSNVKTSWMFLSDIQKKFSHSINILHKGEVLGPFLKNKNFYILKINDVKNNQENIITEFHVQHCLIKTSFIKSDTSAKKNIFNIYNNILKRSYNFNYAAQYLSDDFYSSSKKGDIKWISTSFILSNFHTDLMNLKKNHVSVPIKSNIGWHLFRLLEKRQIDEYYKSVKNSAYHILLNKKIRLERYNWIQDLKKTSYIKIIQ